MSETCKPTSQSGAQSESQTGSQPARHGDTAPEHEVISPKKALVGLGLFLLLVVLLAGWGILHRKSADRVLANTTEELAAPSVTIAQPTKGAPVESFVLPGNTTAYTDSPIYARTSGYLTRWYFDIGARVKKDALLCEISTPEVDQQLAQAKADLNTAEANANNAHIQADRYSSLVQSNAVSRQDTDTFVSQASATAATVRSAQANVKRLEELQSFEKVYAPFDGVVTARNIDTGQLIDAGAAKELFHMQAISTLRVYTNLPQIYAASAKRGEKVGLTFQEHPGKTYEGTLVRTSDAIDPSSRTLLVEVDVNNGSGELLPGSLAEAHFKTPTPAETFVVPAACLIFRREGMRVGTVVNGNVAHLAPVIIGEDDGVNVQIVSGLSANDQVIQAPPDSLIDGEKVTVVSPGSGNGQGGK